MEGQLLGEAVGHEVGQLRLLCVSPHSDTALQSWAREPTGGQLLQRLQDYLLPGSHPPPPLSQEAEEGAAGVGCQAGQKVGRWSDRPSLALVRCTQREWRVTCG